MEGELFRVGKVNSNSQYWEMEGIYTFHIKIVGKTVKSPIQDTSHSHLSEDDNNRFQCHNHTGTNGSPRLVGGGGGGSWSTSLAGLSLFKCVV